MRHSRYRRLPNAAGNKGGPAGADDNTHRHHIAVAVAVSDAVGNKGGPAGADDSTHRHHIADAVGNKGGQAGSDNSTHRHHIAVAASDAVGNKGGPAGADDITSRHHIVVSVAAGATSPDSSSPEAEESELAASSRHPLPRSVLRLYHVGTSPTTGYAAPFVLWASRAREMFYSWRNRTFSLPWLMRRRGDSDSDAPLPPKPSTASRGAPAQRLFIPRFPGDPRAHTPSGPPSQKPFVKWTHGDPRAHTPTSPAPPAPPPPPSPVEQGFLAQLAFAALVIMGIRDGLDDLLSGWNKALKVIFVLSLIVGAGTLAAGLMATSPAVSTGYIRTVLSTCARFCTCLATFVLIVDLSVLMGSHGYIAGIMLGLVSVLYSVSVWIKGDPAAHGVCMRAWNGTKHLCGCFKWFRQKGPILP